MGHKVIPSTAFIAQQNLQLGQFRRKPATWVGFYIILPVSLTT